jgi:RNA recognition motif-containing protein
MAVNLSHQYKTTSAPEKNSRGFAFVEMINTEEADRAIAGLNGADFESRALNVNEARPKGSVVAHPVRDVGGASAADLRMPPSSKLIFLVPRA